MLDMARWVCFVVLQAKFGKCRQMEACSDLLFNSCLLDVMM